MIQHSTRCTGELRGSTIHPTSRDCTRRVSYCTAEGKHQNCVCSYDCDVKATRTQQRRDVLGAVPWPRRITHRQRWAGCARTALEVVDEWGWESGEGDSE